MCKHLYPTCHSSWIHPPGRNVFFSACRTIPKSPGARWNASQRPNEGGTTRCLVMVSDLVGGFNHLETTNRLVVWTPLKNMSSSVGMMTFPYGQIKMFQTTNQWWLVMLTDGWGKNDSTGWMRCWTMSSWARITGDQSFVQKFETVSEHSCSQLQICHAYVGFTGQHRQEWMINGTSIHWMTTKNGPHLRSIETLKKKDISSYQ